jgi:hypothetical protein
VAGLTADSLSPQGRAYARWMLEQLCETRSSVANRDAPASVRNELAAVGLGPATARFASSAVEDTERAIALQVFATNCAFREVALRVSAALADAGIRAVFIKGASQFTTAETWWPLRPMSDLDLLVERTSFAAARAVLRSLAFAVETAPKPSSVWEGQQELVRRTPTGVVRIDLHRGLHHWPIWAGLSEAVLDSATLAGGVYVPSTSGRLLVAAAHRARHAYRVDARELFDVGLMLGAPLDADALVALAERTRCVGALWSLLDEVTALLGQVSDEHVALLARTRRATNVVGRLATTALRRATASAARRGDTPHFWSLYLGLPAAGVGSGRAALGLATHGLLRSADVVVGTLTPGKS